MPRVLTSDMLAAIAAQQLAPAVFLQAQFASGTIYIWSGTGSISWNGHAWSGVGNLLTLSTIEEGANVEARGISIGLSGIDNALLADALQEFQVGAPVVLYLGLFAGTPLALLSDPAIAWAGKMDQPVIDVSAETATITIAAESRLILHNVPCERRYTQDDQVIDNPGDNGFKFVTSIANSNIYWGKTPNAG